MHRQGELNSLTVKEASELIRKGKVSSKELVESTLERIHRIEDKVRAFVTVMDEEARRSSRQADADISQGLSRGPLQGIPVAIKDLVDTAGTRTTSGSKVRANFVPTRDASVVERLKSAGAII